MVRIKNSHIRLAVQYVWTEILCVFAIQEIREKKEEKENKTSDDSWTDQYLQAEKTHAI